MCNLSMVNFHGHTNRSFQDAIIRPEDYAQLAGMLNSTSVAMSDHGNICSWIEFSSAMKKAGIKPILAVEFYFYFAEDPKNKKSHHLLVIAKDDVGYRNILKLLYLSNLPVDQGGGFFYRSRISDDMLFSNKAGLLVGSACLSSPITSRLIDGDEISARIIAEKFKDEFGDNFFMEIFPHKLPIQAEANRKIEQMATEMGIPMCVTLDSHFKNDEYEEAYLINGRNRRNIKEKDVDNEPNCLKEADFHLKTAQEVYDTLVDKHGLMESTVRAAMDHTVQLDKLITFEYKDKFDLPKFCEDSDKYLEKLLGQKLISHFGGREKIPAEYKERLRYEFNVVKEKKFCDYFNILYDTVEFCRQDGIRLGGRGSVGGSLMAFLLGFNPMDPIKYALPFERFLNPFRSSMPDVDLDCPGSKREYIIEYLKSKWGNKRVVQVITFGEVKAKVAIKEVAKYFDIPFQEVNTLTSHIPSFEKEDGALHDLPLTKALEIPEVAAYQKKNPQLFKLALQLEGTYKSYGVHAGGVVILPDDAENIIPVMHKKGEAGADVQISAWEKKDIEKIGLVKYDFLGLNTLEILGECEKLVGIKLEDIPLDNPATWRFIQDARFMNSIFQLSEPKTRKYLRDAKPENLFDLAAVNTGIRPGADWDTFIEGKKKRKYNGKFDLPEFKETLKNTYGAILFQDDILFLFARLSDLTLGESDLLRRALEKGDRNGAKQYEDKFIQTCKYPNLAQDIFDYICQSMGYVFNSSHCLVYSLNGYWCAYFKANYPHEFLIANMKHARSSGKMTETEFIAELIKEAREMGIKVNLPTFQKAKIEPWYSRADNCVYLGVGNIKGIGEQAAGVLVDAATKTGTFKEFSDYCVNTKVDTGRLKKDGTPIMRPLVNKGHINTLVCMGFFGEIEPIVQEYEVLFKDRVEIKSEAEMINEALGFDYYSPFESYRSKLPDYLQDKDRYLIVKVIELKSGQKNGRKWHLMKANSENGQISAFMDSAAGIDKNDVLLVEYSKSKSDALNIRSYKLL